MYSYYIPKQKLFRGTAVFEFHLRHEYEHERGEDEKVGHYDGASIMPDGRIVIIVGNHGAGTGRRVERVAAEWSRTRGQG